MTKDSNAQRPGGELVNEARRIVSTADEVGVTLRITGGLGVAIQCPSAARPPLKRTYKDLDLVGKGTQGREIDELMKGLQLTPGEEFNSLHGKHQRIYTFPDGRILDVFIDRIVMCHVLDVHDRLDLDQYTLSPEDLLLSKLQVLEAKDSDLKDALALLSDCRLDEERIATVLSRDWGWWRTVTEVLQRVREYAHTLSGLGARDEIVERISSLERRIEAEPKSMRWRARGVVGDKVPWYQVPEEAQS